MSQVDPNEKFEEKMKHHEIIDYILLMSEATSFVSFSPIPKVGPLFVS